MRETPSGYVLGILWGIAICRVATAWYCLVTVGHFGGHWGTVGYRGGTVGYCGVLWGTVRYCEVL